jgi:hypothetical protein
MGLFDFLIKDDGVIKMQYVKMPAPVDLKKVKYSKITKAEVRKLLEDYFKAISRPVSFPSGIGVDTEYLCYEEAVVKEALQKRPAMYDHSAQLKGVIKEPCEGGDCDNTAEWRSAMLHSVLPSICCIYTSGYRPGFGHRWLGTVLIDKKTFFWSGQDADKFTDYNTIIIVDF